MKGSLVHASISPGGTTSTWERAMEITLQELRTQADILAPRLMESIAKQISLFQ